MGVRIPQFGRETFYGQGADQHHAAVSDCTRTDVHLLSWDCRWVCSYVIRWSKIKRYLSYTYLFNIINIWYIRLLMPANFKTSVYTENAVRLSVFDSFVLCVRKRTLSGICNLDTRRRPDDARYRLKIAAKLNFKICINFKDITPLIDSRINRLSANTKYKWENLKIIKLFVKFVVHFKSRNRRKKRALILVLFLSNNCR